VTGLNDTLGIAASGMTAQSHRLRHVAENIANADTPGYRRKSVAFNPTDQGGVTPGRVRLDTSALSSVHDPGHPMAGPDGSYAGSNVDLLIEIADAREAQRSYEANLKVFDQARQMTQGLYDILRR
jgi:flagellar basal-body rod protein FlgC